MRTATGLLPFPAGIVHASPVKRVRDRTITQADHRPLVVVVLLLFLPCHKGSYIFEGCIITIVCVCVCVRERVGAGVGTGRDGIKGR